MTLKHNVWFDESNIDSFEQLKQAIKQQGVISGKYYDQGSCCIIGHMANIIGVVIPDESNGSGISSLSLTHIEHKLHEYFNLSRLQMKLLKP